jgi:hypothetical protein
VAPRDDSHLATFGFHLGKQSGLLLGRPLPTPLDPRNDLSVRQRRLLLELQKESPEDAKIADPGQAPLHGAGRTLTLGHNVRRIEVHPGEFSRYCETLQTGRNLKALGDFAEAKAAGRSY